MATFKAQVEGVTSLTIGTTPTDDELSQFLVDGTREVINRIISVKPNEIPKFGASTNDASDSGVPLTGKILSVVREHDSVSIVRPCSPIDLSDRYLAGDVDSLQYRSKYNPGFYILDGKVHTIPASAGSDNDAIVTQVYYAVNQGHSSSSIDSFPDEYEYLVVLYASFRSIHANMGAKDATTLDAFSSIPISPEFDFSVITQALTAMIIPSGIVMPTLTFDGFPGMTWSFPTVPIAPITSAVSVADFSSTAPTYTAPVVVLRAAPTISDLSITAVSPDSFSNPTINSPGVETIVKADISGMIPAYSKPTVAVSTFAAFAGTLTNLSLTAVAPDEPTLSTSSVTITGTAPTYAAPTEVALSTFAAFSGTLANLTITTPIPIGLIDPNITSPGIGTTSKADIIGHMPTYTKPSTAISAVSPTVPTLETLTTFNLTAVAPDSVADPIIASDGVDTLDKPVVTGSQPQYNGGSVIGFAASFAALATKTVTDLSIIAVSPDTPTGVIEAFGSIPSYTAPQVGGVTEELTATISTGNSQTNVSDWFEVAGDYIQTEEDSELASSQLDKIAGYITAYSSQVSNNLNEFNAANTLYQADIQKKIKESDLELAKFSAELNEYQQEVNREVTEWQANKDKDIELWNTQQGHIIQQQQSQMQDALNLFNKDNAIFQADIQATLAKAQADAQEYQKEGDLLLQAKVQDYTLTLQKFQADTQAYQTEVASEVQEYTQQLQDVTTANASNLQKYQSELSLHQAEISKEAQIIQANIQSELNKFNKENMIYQASVQSELAKFQADAAEAQKEGDLTLQSSIQDYTLNLQKFQSDVTSYQAGVNTEVVEYTQNLQKAIQTWTGEHTQELGIYQSNLQNSLNEFNKLNAEYQAILQKDIQDAQLSDSADNKKLTQYQAEVATYQIDVNTQIAEYTQNLQKALQTWTGEQANTLAIYQTDIQNELNEFNKDNAAYQANVQAELAKVQIDAQEAQKEGDLSLQADIQEYTLTLQNFQANLAAYQAEVATEVQEYTQNLTGDIQVWQAERTTDLQKYTADLQNALNIFNRENAIYQATVQEKLQEAQLEDAEESRKLAKYQAEVTAHGTEVQSLIQQNQAEIAAWQTEWATRTQKYTAEVGAIVQEYQAEIAGESQISQSQVAIYTAQLQRASQEHQSDLAVYQAGITAYQADVQAKMGKHTQELQSDNAEYQWLQDQYTRIKAEYDTAFLALAPPQPVPQNKRN